jgi:hypothetical protein
VGCSAAADYVDRVLKGGQTSELTVERLAKRFFIIQVVLIMQAVLTIQVILTIQVVLTINGPKAVFSAGSSVAVGAAQAPSASTMRLRNLGLDAPRPRSYYCVMLV